MKRILLAVFLSTIAQISLAEDIALNQLATRIEVVGFVGEVKGESGIIVLFDKSNNKTIITQLGKAVTIADNNFNVYTTGKHIYLATGSQRIRLTFRDGRNTSDSGSYSMNAGSESEQEI